LLPAFEEIIFCTLPNFNNFFTEKLFYMGCYFVFSKLTRILYISLCVINVGLGVHVTRAIIYSSLVSGVFLTLGYKQRYL
jgi:hypothetical protein